MSYSNTSKLLLSILIVTSVFSLSAQSDNAKQDIFINETQEMYKNFGSSDLGKFLKDRLQNEQNQRMFINQLHGQSMRLSAYIQQELVKNRDAVGYDELYKNRLKAFTSLKYCIETQKYFNNVTVAAKINAGAALLYTAAARECDGEAIKPFMAKEAGRAKLWRDFTHIVERSIPGAQAKKAKFQEGFITTFAAQTEKTLGAYRAFPYSKSLKPEVVKVTEPAMVSKGELPALPATPFNHDQAEWMGIIKHIEELVKRLSLASNNEFIKIICKPLLEKEKYNPEALSTCAMFVNSEANRLVAFKLPADTLVKFSSQYQQSAMAPAKNVEAEKRAVGSSMPLPPSRPKFVVSELNMYREAIKSMAPNALASCPGTDTTGLNDDLKNADNKALFIKVTRALYDCSLGLYKGDNTTFHNLFRSMKNYRKGSRKV
jgi:hypothetical protein